MPQIYSLENVGTYILKTKEYTLLVIIWTLYNVQYMECTHIDKIAYPLIMLVLNIYVHYPKDISPVFFEIT